MGRKIKILNIAIKLILSKKIIVQQNSICILHTQILFLATYKVKSQII